MALKREQIEAMVGMNADAVVYALNLRILTRSITPVERDQAVDLIGCMEPHRVYVIFDPETHDVLEIMGA